MVAVIYIQEDIVI